MDWDKLRDIPSPWIPDLKGDEDTANFEKFEEQEAWGAASVSSKKKTKKSGEDQLLPDWTWKIELEEKKQNFINALKGVKTNPANSENIKPESGPSSFASSGQKQGRPDNLDDSMNNWGK